MFRFFTYYNTILIYDLLLKYNYFNILDFFKIKKISFVYKFGFLNNREIYLIFKGMFLLNVLSLCY